MTMTSGQAFALLKNDRAAFIQRAPELGIAKSIAERVFSPPRHIDVCTTVLAEVIRNQERGTVEPVLLIAARHQDTFNARGAKR